MTTKRDLKKQPKGRATKSTASKSAASPKREAAVKRAKSGVLPKVKGKASKAPSVASKVSKSNASSQKVEPPKAVRSPRSKVAAQPQKSVTKVAAKVKKSIANSRGVSSKAKPVAAKSKAVKAPGSKAVGKKQSTLKPAAPKAPAKPSTNARLLKKIRELQSEREAVKNIAFRPRLIKPPGEGDPFWEKAPQSDRIGLFVRDPYWLHVAWDITRGAVERAQAALAQQWHTARPVLRLVRLDDAETGAAAESVQAEIEIRGGVRNWYIPWTGEAAVFRVNIGYQTSQGRFHLIASSNIVKVPAASSPDATDDHWTHLAPEGEKIFALSGGYDAELQSAELKSMLEERLNRSLGAPELARLAIAADVPMRFRSDFFFDLDVELVFYGATEPHSYVTINEEPVTLRPDGSFAMRVPFPERRNVISAVAIARDGSNQRTVVVGVERNTKVMDLLDREADTGD